MLKTVSRKTKVQQSLESENFNINYAFEHDEGKVPEMITARAGMLNQNLKEGENPCRVDVSLYPSTGNLQITVHNKPEGFAVNLLAEIVEPLDEIVADAVGE